MSKIANKCPVCGDAIGTADWYGYQMHLKKCRPEAKLKNKELAAKAEARFKDFIVGEAPSYLRISEDMKTRVIAICDNVIAAIDSINPQEVETHVDNLQIVRF